MTEEQNKLALNPVTNEPWDRWEIELLIEHLQNPESAPWLQGWSPMQQKLMVDGLKSLLREREPATEAVRDEVLEMAAKVCEKRAQALSEDPNNGYVEGDTNAFIWTNLEAGYVAEELDEAATAICALKGKGASQGAFYCWSAANGGKRCEQQCSGCYGPTAAPELLGEFVRAYCAANDYINALTGSAIIPPESMEKIKAAYWDAVRKVK